MTWPSVSLPSSCGEHLKPYAARCCQHLHNVLTTRMCTADRVPLIAGGSSASSRSALHGEPTRGAFTYIPSVLACGAMSAHPST